VLDCDGVPPTNELTSWRLSSGSIPVFLTCRLGGVNHGTRRSENCVGLTVTSSAAPFSCLSGEHRRGGDLDLDRDLDLCVVLPRNAGEDDLQIAQNTNYTYCMCEDIIVINGLLCSVSFNDNVASVFHREKPSTLSSNICFML